MLHMYQSNTLFIIYQFSPGYYFGTFVTIYLHYYIYLFLIKHVGFNIFKEYQDYSLMLHMYHINVLDFITTGPMNKNNILLLKLLKLYVKFKLRGEKWIHL